MSKDFAKPNIVCAISGPTASGKTKASLELCRRGENAEIVNFDSLLFYRELNIGTAKPDLRERSLCPHHLIDIRSAADHMNAAEFAKEALETVLRLHREDKIPVLTGGSGFYLQALLYGMFDSKTTGEDIRRRSEQLYRAEGITPFLDILKENDPESFQQYHPNDHYRIRRAVEHFWTTGRKFSRSRRDMMASREENSNIRKYGWNFFHAYLDVPKPLHLELIGKRTKAMLKQGLVEETKSLLERGFTGQEKPLQSIGYKEALQYLRGEIDRNGLEERINISTRQLAKAQRTWFKKIEKNSYNPLEDMERLFRDFENFVNHLRGAPSP